MNRAQFLVGAMKSSRFSAKVEWVLFTRHQDLELDRLVALKIIRPELTKNPEILRRFKQELILARQVTHRNVIRIFDLGQADGFKFLASGYLDGKDLIRAVLKEKGKLSPEEAARIIVQICRALEVAHGEGVVHRDLKPQNIVLDANGRAYVMDFGIARSTYLPGIEPMQLIVRDDRESLASTAFARLNDIEEHQAFGSGARAWSWVRLWAS